MKKKVIRLTESDLARIVRRVLMEQGQPEISPELMECITKSIGEEVPEECITLLNDIIINKKIPTNPFDPNVIACGTFALRIPSKLPNILKCVESNTTPEKIN